MKKTFSWVGSKGNVIELVAEYKSEIKKEVLNADGYELETDNFVARVKANLITKVDGKEVDSCWDTNFWKVIDTNTNGIKRIWGCSKIGFNAEIAAQVEEFLKSVIAEGKSEEVIALEAKKTEEKKAEEIEEAQKIVDVAEKQEKIMTAREAKIWRNATTYLSTSEKGYIPQVITLEEYNRH